MRCARSEGAGAEAISSEASGRVFSAPTAAAIAAPAAAAAADPLAAGEAIDELLAENDDHEIPRNASTQSPASLSKGSGQLEGEGATSSRSNRRQQHSRGSDARTATWWETTGRHEFSV